MRRLTPILAVLVAAGSLAWGATPVYVSSDVPTTIGTVTLLPWQIYRYDAAGPTYTLMLTVPGGPNVDAIHKMDTAGGWLLSVDAPNDLGGALPTDAEPQDVVMFKGGVYSIVFCPGLLGVPPGVTLDGGYTAGGDGGRLVASFDVPVERPSGSGTWDDPADLGRWTPAGAGCAGAGGFVADGDSGTARSIGGGVVSAASAGATLGFDGNVAVD